MVGAISTPPIDVSRFFFPCIMKWLIILILLVNLGVHYKSITVVIGSVQWIIVRMLWKILWFAISQNHPLRTSGLSSLCFFSRQNLLRRFGKKQSYAYINGGNWCIEVEPYIWSSLVTFDGQRLPRWSSSSRFVVDCQPLDLPHQLLTSRDFLFAILLSTASFPLDLPHRLLSSRFLVDCQLPLDLPHRLLSSRFVWPCLPISESHDAFPAPTDAFPAPTISHSRALVCLACCAFLCQPLSLTLVESYRTIIE